MQIKSQPDISTAMTTAPADGAEHEAAGDHEHVDDDDVLQPRRVGDEEDDVRERRDQERPRDSRALSPRPAEDERDRRRDGDADGEPTGGNRARHACADRADRARGRRRRSAGRSRPTAAQKIANASSAVHAALVKSRCAKDQPRENEQILHPLPRAHRHDDRGQHRHHRTARGIAGRREHRGGRGGRDDHAARVRCSCGGWAPSGRMRSGAAPWERVPSTPLARPGAPGSRFRRRSGVAATDRDEPARRQGATS